MEVLMKTIIKKSVFTSLCAFALLVSALPALAMETSFDSKDTNLLAPQSVQEFAKQCYKTMDQCKDDYSLRQHKEIDDYVTTNNAIQVYIGKLPQNLNISACGLYDGQKIVLDTAFWTQETNNTSTTLTPALKQVICHETAHAWLGHNLRELSLEKIKKTGSKIEYLKQLYLVSVPQIEFEAETLMVRTLYALDEQQAITAQCQYLHALTSDHNAYTMGLLNGIAHIKNDVFKIALMESPMKKLKFFSQLCGPWKPVEKYSEAQAQICEILQNEKQKTLKNK
jgi:hypothetical protein